MFNLKRIIIPTLLGVSLFLFNAFAQEEMKTYFLKKGETITDALWNRGFKPLYGPKGILSKILNFNNVTFEDAKKLRPGYPLKVPVELHAALMRPVPPKVDRPIEKPVPTIQPETPARVWSFSSKWAAGLYYFYHFYEEDNKGEFVETKKEQQLGLDLRNDSRINEFIFDSQFLLTKIHGGDFPLEFGLYERISNTDFSVAHISPFITAGYEKFSYLGANKSTLMTKDFSSMMLGGGLKWELSFANKRVSTSLEYLKSSSGGLFHPWVGLDWNKQIYSELHFFQVDFEKGSEVSGTRFNFNLGHRF